MQLYISYLILFNIDLASCSGRCFPCMPNVQLAVDLHSVLLVSYTPTVTPRCPSLSLCLFLPRSLLLAVTHKNTWDTLFLITSCKMMPTKQQSCREGRVARLETMTVLMSPSLLHIRVIGCSRWFLSCPPPCFRLGTWSRYCLLLHAK